ncbi:MEMO1 family [Mycena maculata]|uniref:MEMO1 family n=1 Tax=Mycena maculata TaxID=230809 RepID=A0AAD7P1C4_9AGAR|nr:MEMO1 family [Mycena maculata]
MSRHKRTASHAGDWYSDDADELDRQLTLWLRDVSEDGYPIPKCKAVIAPHAGYSYSGPTAAWAYKSIDTRGIKRVFVLGPSHHIYLDGCALPSESCTAYATPLGDLPLDTETIKELGEINGTPKFKRLSRKADEDEHSLEMHLPYIRKMFLGQEIVLVPIMVGAISRDSEATFGALLAPYLAREDTFTVVSSDFCHWGTRFQYTYYYPAPGPDAEPVRLSRSTIPDPAHPIHASIRRLDHEAMDLLTLPSPASPPGTAADAHTAFVSYLARTKNTICGRHPIGVLFGALTALEQQEEAKKAQVKWVRYAQSNACESVRDSSVSYASAWVHF